MISARVTVFLKDDVMDPQGEAVQQALVSLGHAGVSRVRVGRCFDVTLASEDTAAAKEELRLMSEALLANTVIERFEVEL